MQVIKRNKQKTEFQKDKIIKAILKAFIDVDSEETQYAKEKAREIATHIERLGKELSVEEIQDIVEEKLMASNRKDVARAYVRYRYKKELVRESNTTDESIKELIEGTSEYWNTENSNKNASVVTTQRDYIAGITSTDISKRFLLPKDIVDAHEKGIIHFHDIDYFAQKSLTNCELINLEDMLQNGTVINNVRIDKPHRLITAATIATQIIMAVTSSTYGGATISLSHLAPFVRDSFVYHKTKYIQRNLTEEEAIKWATEDLKKEITDAVQTFNYQVNSMTNTNGQAPFLSVFMYLHDDEEYITETAMLIEEFLNQRIVGFKNKVGHYITPAFPKLLYVLEDDNITEDGKYFYLTKLAAKCTAKRMVPDYISEKIMKKLKGDVYACMGCRSFLTPDISNNGFGNISGDLSYKSNKPKYWGRLTQKVEPTLNCVNL